MNKKLITIIIFLLNINNSFNQSANTTYSPLSHSSTTTFSDGLSATTTYLPLSNSSRTTFSDGSSATTTYSPLSNSSRTTFSDGSSAMTTYSPLSNSSRTTFSDGLSATSTYSPFSNSSRTTFSDGSSATTTYSSLSHSSTTTFNFSSTLTKINLPSLYSSRTSFDKLSSENTYNSPSSYSSTPTSTITGLLSILNQYLEERKRESDRQEEMALNFAMAQWQMAMNAEYDKTKFILQLATQSISSYEDQLESLNKKITEYGLSSEIRSENPSNDVITFLNDLKYKNISNFRTITECREFNNQLLNKLDEYQKVQQNRINLLRENVALYNSGKNNYLIINEIKSNGNDYPNITVDEFNHSIEMLKIKYPEMKQLENTVYIKGLKSSILSPSELIKDQLKTESLSNGPSENSVTIIKRGHWLEVNNIFDGKNILALYSSQKSPLETYTDDENSNISNNNQLTSNTHNLFNESGSKIINIKGNYLLINIPNNSTFNIGQSFNIIRNNNNSINIIGTAQIVKISNNKAALKYNLSNSEDKLALTDKIDLIK